MEKLNNIFLPYKVDAIKAIHLNGNDKEDRRFWIKDKKGNYTVKSGYWNLYHNVLLKDNPSSPM